MGSEDRVRFRVAVLVDASLPSGSGVPDPQSEACEAALLAVSPEAALDGMFVGVLASPVDVSDFLKSLGPLPMILHCPECRARHVDCGAFADHPHHTHACQACGMTWRPAVFHTVGVQFLPGFKDADPEVLG